VRIERPQPIDLRAIADGVIKNNMGVGGIELRVRGALQDGTATMAETGQELPVVGGPPRSQASWLWLDAKAFGLGEADAVSWLQESSGPVRAP
jgi:hypothetical protein